MNPETRTSMKFNGLGWRKHLSKRHLSLTPLTPKGMTQAGIGQNL